MRHTIILVLAVFAASLVAPASARSLDLDSIQNETGKNVQKAEQKKNSEEVVDEKVVDQLRLKDSGDDSSFFQKEAQENLKGQDIKSIYPIIEQDRKEAVALAQSITGMLASGRGELEWQLLNPKKTVGWAIKGYWEDPFRWLRGVGQMRVAALKMTSESKLNPDPASPIRKLGENFFAYSPDFTSNGFYAIGNMLAENWIKLYKNIEFSPDTGFWFPMPRTECDAKLQSKPYLHPDCREGGGLKGSGWQFGSSHLYIKHQTVMKAEDLKTALAVYKQAEAAFKDLAKRIAYCGY